MHPYLRVTIEAFTQQYRDDPRCAGLFLTGSGGKGTDDAYSDVDLVLVVEDAAYQAISAELRHVCERICGAIHLWFPEGERPGACNYAFLFEAGGEQFLYDFTVMTLSALQAAAHVRPEAILFDRGGTLAALQSTRVPAPYVPDRLRYTIDHYWIYAYLNGKYSRREDVLKMLYIQQVLFTVHLRLLRALHPEGEWGWWPRDLKRLPAETQTAMLRYFPPPETARIREALVDELTRFGADARAASARWGETYPEDLERYVRRHLFTMGALHSSRA